MAGTVADPAGGDTMSASLKIFLVGALGCALLLGPLALVGFVAMAQQSASPGCAPASVARVAPVGDWSRAQVANAATIVTVGTRRGIPARGWVIAVATAMQESRLTNLGDLGAHNDHDSLGLFQQRPSQGWGTAQQIMDPLYASTKFYQALKRINSWQIMPLTKAAQAVQKSAYPNAYAKWENDANTLVRSVGSGGSWAIPGDREQCLSNCPPILSNDSAGQQKQHAGAAPTSAGLLKTVELTEAQTLLTLPDTAGQRAAVAHDPSEPTNTVVSGDPRAIPVDPEQCMSICPAVVTSPDTLDESCVEVSAVFDRARSWLTAWQGGPVPYLSSNVPGDLLRGYRRDCSGYVSMALGLRGPGLSTVDLAQRSTMIGKSDLRPGDLMINPDTDLRGHVVLFAGWVDASMGSYYGYEQSGDGGTHFRKITYPYFGSYRMSPYRLGN